MKFTIVLISFLLIGCQEIETGNAKEAYKYWIKSDANSEVKIINGKYWQSPHWSLEYELFLELYPTENWWKEFKKQNNLIIDNLKNQEFQNKKPYWFKPTKNFIEYKVDDNFDQGSRYFRDTLSGKVFIYEIQL